MFYPLFTTNHYEETIEWKQIEIESEIEENQDDICCICLEPDSVISLQKAHLLYNIVRHCSCKEMVHNYCIRSWFTIKNSCPICNTRMINYHNTALFPNERGNLPFYIFSSMAILCLYILCFYSFFLMIFIYIYFFVNTVRL